MPFRSSSPSTIKTPNPLSGPKRLTKSWKRSAIVKPLLKHYTSDLLIASQFYQKNRPDKPLTPKRVDQTVTEYLARRTQLSIKRKTGLACILGHFSKQFGGRALDQIGAAEISDFIATRNWKPKTVNDFLCAVS